MTQEAKIYHKSEAAKILPNHVMLTFEELGKLVTNHILSNASGEDNLATICEVVELFP